VHEELKRIETAIHFLRRRRDKKRSRDVFHRPSSASAENRRGSSCRRARFAAVARAFPGLGAMTGAALPAVPSRTSWHRRSSRLPECRRSAGPLAPRFRSGAGPKGSIEYPSPRRGYPRSTICATASCLNSSVKRTCLPILRLSLVPKLPSKASTNLGAPHGSLREGSQSLIAGHRDTGYV